MKFLTVNFDPTTGSEIKKTRLALILQNNISNQYSPIIIVAAITSQFSETLYPTEVLVQAPEGGLQVNSVVLLNQIRSIDKQPLIKRLGNLELETGYFCFFALLVNIFYPFNFHRTMFLP